MGDVSRINVKKLTSLALCLHIFPGGGEGEQTNMCKNTHARFFSCGATQHLTLYVGLPVCLFVCVSVCLSQILSQIFLCLNDQAYNCLIHF